MKKLGVIANIAGIVTALLIAFLGYAVPKRILRSMEFAEVGSQNALSVIGERKEDIAIAGSTPYPSAFPMDRPEYRDERRSMLYSELYRLERAMNMHVREPRDGELKMGNAVEIARMCTDALFRREAFPFLDVYDFELIGATLTEPVMSGGTVEYEQTIGEYDEDFAVWTVDFIERSKEGDSSVSVMLDAASGIVFSLSVFSPVELGKLDKFDMLITYAELMGLMPSDGSFEGWSADQGAYINVDGGFRFVMEDHSRENYTMYTIKAGTTAR